MESWFYSLSVMFGSGAIAILLASPVALALQCYQPWGSRAARSLLTAYLFVPLYVIAGAWNAGFGSVGWWTLTQVSSAQHPLRGLFAVMWIHGTGAFAAVAWLLGMGLARARVRHMELASLSGGSASLWRHVWLPALLRWSLMSWLLTAAMVGSDMLVTNLYRLPTLTEAAYLSVQGGDDSIALFMQAMLPSLIFSIVVGLVVAKSSSIAWEDVRPNEYQPDQGWTKTLASSFFLWSILAIVFILPISNLVLKAGWDPKMARDGIQRSWSLQKFGESFQSVGELGEKAYWSLQLAIPTATIAVLFAAIAVVVVPRKSWSRGILAGIAFFGLCMPGPIVNLLVKRFCESLPTPLDDWMLESTLGAPIMALQFRCMSMAWFCLLVAWDAWETRYGELAKQLAWIRQSREFFIANYRILLLAWGLCFAMGVSDLASYLLVLPPGVRTISLWIFEQLHYGVRYKEAGLNLFLMILGLVFGFVSSFVFQRTSRSRYT